MKSIFVIEDDPDVIQVIKDVFEMVKIKGNFFSSSVEGFKELKSIGTLDVVDVPQLVIMDLMMPGVSGFELCKLIRSKDRLKNTSIVVITGYDSPKIRKEVALYGVNDYLAKPFDIKEFRSKFLSLIKK